MHTHTHIHKRDGSSQSLSETRSSIVHTFRVVVGGGAGELWGWAADSPRRRPASSNVRPRAVTERRDEVILPRGRQGSGKKGGRREDALLTVSRAKLLRSPRTQRTLSRTCRKQPPRSPPREPLVVAKRLRSPFLFNKHPGRPAEEAALLSPARGKIEGQASAAQVFGVAVRRGKEIAFRFGNTKASPFQTVRFSGRNQAIENPRSLVALVLV